MVNEGLVSLLTDELTTYLTTMSYEHTNLEHTSMICEVVEKVKESPKDSKPDAESQASEGSTSAEGKVSLFARRKGPLSSQNEDELKVVIERDNMIVGFVDAVDSDATEDSQSEDETLPLRRKCLKRARSQSPKAMKKVIIILSYYLSYRRSNNVFFSLTKVLTFSSQPFSFF